MLKMLALISLMAIAQAQITIECTPSTLFPNDVADCKLKITFPRETYVSSFSFSNDVDVMPKSISGVGWVSSYELPFNLKAGKPGIHTIDVYINTLNGTIKQTFNVVVVGDMPRIILNKTTLYLNEVNTLSFKVVSPFEISNVIVKPLFPSDPQTIYGMEGSFKFIPKEKPLRFEISFYNGRNSHTVIQSVDVSYKESKGVILNLTPRYSVSLIGDVVSIPVEISNLRTDLIYNVTVKSNAEPSIVTIPYLNSGESRCFDLKFSSNESGLRFVNVTVKYFDEFNNPYILNSQTSILFLDEYALQFSGVDVRSGVEVEVGGDVCNNGRTKVYNIYVIAEADGTIKNYYIDSLEPSDFDSFEFTFKNASFVRLKVKWNNELGEVFEIEKILSVQPVVESEEGGDYIIPIAVLIGVVVLILLGFRYARRAGSSKSKEDKD